MMLLGVWLVNAIFTQKFTSFSEVALNTDTAGLNLPARADVKVRGEIIGQVTKAESSPTARSSRSASSPTRSVPSPRT